MKRSFWISAAKYLFGIGLLAFLLYRNWETPPGSKAPGLRDALRMPIHYGSIAIAAVCYFLAVMTTFVRWYVLVRAQGLPFTLPSALRLGLVGYFFSNFLPGGIGGDLVKGAAIAREQSRRTVAIATVLIDRAVGLLGIIVIVALMGTIFWLAGDPAIAGDAKMQWIVKTTVGMVIAVIIGWLVLGLLPDRRAEIFAGRLGRIPKLGGAASEFWRAIWIYRNRGGVILLALAMTVMLQVFFVFSFYFAAQVFRQDNQPPDIPTLTQHFLLVPLGVAIQALFPTPGGLGGSEYGFGKLYALAGKQEITGFLASLAWRVINYLLSFCGYIVYLQMKSDLVPSNAQAAPGEIST